MGFANQPLVVDKLYVYNFNHFNRKAVNKFCSEKNLYVLDCRPKVNAMGNRAKGAGYEDTTTSYPNCILEFLDIGSLLFSSLIFFLILNFETSNLVFNFHFCIHFDFI
jgi:hypothetical protein